MKPESSEQFTAQVPSLLDETAENPVHSAIDEEFVDPDEIISDVARQRADILTLWKQAGYDAVVEKYGSIGQNTLYRWQRTLREANGKVSVLNPVEPEPKLNLEQDLSAVTEMFLPEASYASFVTDPETGLTHTVIDISEIKKVLGSEILYRGVRVSRRRILDFLVEKYKSKKVLTPDQVQKSEFEPKPLFYIPSSATDAVNSIEISEDDSHVGLWDVCNTRAYSLKEGDSYPTIDGSPLTIHEARFAYRLFHPKYGNARRNAADGILMVRNPEYDSDDTTSKKRVSLTRDVLRSYGIDVRHGSEVDRETISGMLQLLPNLVAQKELRPEDFSRQHTLNAKGEFNSNFTPKEIPANGTVVLNGVRQYVGRQFTGCIVHPFTNNKAIVFREESGRRVLVAAFTIVGKENASAIDGREDGRSVPRANVDKTKVQAIKYAAKLPQNATALDKSLAPQKQVELENKVTEAVTQLIETARRAEELVRSELADAELNIVVAAVDKVRTDLLMQAEKAIEMAASTTDALSLTENIESFAYDARGYVSVLQSVGAEKMLSQPLEQIPAVELSDTDRSRMRELLRANYQGETPEFQALVADSLEKHLADVNTDFYLLRNQSGSIISFNRFDRLYKDEQLHHHYFGSFNADPIYYGVGSIMLERTIQEKLRDCPLMQAHCDPRAKISQKYIEDGFIATQTVSPAGKFSFEIWRSKDSSEQLTTKQMSQDELVGFANETMSADRDFFVREIEPNDEFIELDSGLAYLMTRYFSVGDKTYAAFELNVDLATEFFES